LDKRASQSNPGYRTSGLPAVAVIAIVRLASAISTTVLMYILYPSSIIWR
jgi:hypothetical protein